MQLPPNTNYHTWQLVQEIQRDNAKFRVCVYNCALSRPRFCFQCVIFSFVRFHPSDSHFDNGIASRQQGGAFTPCERAKGLSNDPITSLLNLIQT